MRKFRHQKIQAATTGGGGTSSPYLPVLVLCICFGAYSLNGAPLPSNDQMANMLLSVNLLKRQSFAISLWQTPKVFKWVVERSPGKAVKTQVYDWNDEATELYRKGQLKPTGMPYFLTPTVHAEQYANTFGIGAALTILPVYAVLNLFTDLASNHAVWWHGAKVTASLLTAGAALLIFLTMRRFVPPLPAVLGALAFGLGTCAWTLSSQALWQQTPYLFFLSLGAWWLGGVEAQPHRALYCGAAFGMATLCRPTGIIPVVLVGLYLLWLDPPRIIRSARDRVIENALDLGITSPRFLRVLGAAPDGGGSREEDKPNPPSETPRLSRYMLGGLPFAVILGTYNTYYFGGPFVFPQEIVADAYATSKGATGVWGTPIAEGLAGLLVSPSRGLMVYSPIMVFGFVGAVLTWHTPRKFAMLIPLQIAVLAQIVMAATWYDWWGGWAYGPRPLVDAGVFLTLLMIPVMVRVMHVRWMRGVFVALLLYSVAVQVIGAWTCNLEQWNYKNKMSIDKPEYHSRLWSIRDSQIIHHVTNFQAVRQAKRRKVARYLNATWPMVTFREPGQPYP